MLTLATSYVTADWAKLLVNTVVSDCVIEAQNLTATDGIDYSCSSQPYYYILCLFREFENQYQIQFGWAKNIICISSTKSMY